jgi:16S rRNA (cytidine1402-2'-O)-methyltransferase
MNESIDNKLIGKLFVVATPIGNLEDITLRAIRILKEVDLILCEDTRTTKRLLNHYDITTPTESFHAHTTDNKIDSVIQRLREGRKIALVTDAGTPGISDPGAVLVNQIYSANSAVNSATNSTADSSSDSDIKVEVIPGPSALTAAFSISGVMTSDFLFLGFLPHKKGRETLFNEICQSDRAVVFYESTHRILKTLESLQKHFELSGQSDRKISVTRELTKIYEEVRCANASELLQYFTVEKIKTKGEFVCIVWPK